jgi:hypothetical protein
VWYRYAWPLWLLNLIFFIPEFLVAAFPRIDIRLNGVWRLIGPARAQSYTRMAILMQWRALVFALCQLHLTSRALWPKWRRLLGRFALRRVPDAPADYRAERTSSRIRAAQLAPPKEYLHKEEAGADGEGGPPRGLVRSRALCELVIDLLKAAIEFGLLLYIGTRLTQRTHSPL